MMLFRTFGVSLVICACAPLGADRRSDLEPGVPGAGDVVVAPAPEPSAVPEVVPPVEVAAAAAPRPGIIKDWYVRRLQEPNAELEPWEDGAGAVLESAAACAAGSSDEVCDGLDAEGVIGVKDGEIAVRVADTGNRKNRDGYVGWTARTSELDPLAAHDAVHFKGVYVPHRGAPEGKPVLREIWQWVLDVAQRGFVPADHLIRSRAGISFGTWGYHRPTVLLRAPLAGWMIDTTRDDTEGSFVLVSPDNQTRYVLGTIAGAKGRDVDWALSVLDVVLMPDRRTLVVVGELSLGRDRDGAPDVSPRFVRAWPLPDGVALAAP